MGEFTTNWAEPWALVKWGGEVPGQRPKTRFGFITEAVARNGQITGYRVRTCSGAGKWTKGTTLYRPGEIVRMWRTRPDEKTIRKAKGALQPVER